jgi:hypothetical protein
LHTTVVSVPTIESPTKVAAAHAGVKAAYCDEKVANREIRVWHFVIENGY